MIKKSFWRNKKVLITGHTSFKGFWMCNLLKNLKFKIYGISLKKDIKYSLKNIVKFFFFFDTCNSTGFKKIYDKIKPEIVFHFAAQSIVSDGYKYPKNKIFTLIFQ